MKPLILILSVLSVSLLITGCFANNGQCTYARSRKSSSTVYRQAYNTVQDSTRYACGFLWLWRCTRYSRRYVYYRASSVHYYTSYYSVTQCCSGYAAINGQCRPHCSQGCSHGSCTSPGVCSCSSGWTGSSCSDDIVECSSNNGGCAQHCSNSEGSYSCYCSSGYNLATDGHSCVDINECNTNNGGCSYSCANNDGSYTCSCRNGYHLGNDDHTCVDTNECLNNNGGCSDNCNNSPGSYSCSCNSNYYLTTDKHTCLDINECTNGAVGIGINNGTNWCEQLCVNTPGSYRCDCHPGYILNSDNETCSDINECLDNNGDCSQICTNTPGSHICSCQSGYTLLEDKTSCTDHCECCTGADDCQHVCHNTAGSYYCTCWSGYRVSATNSSACEDINECSDGSSGCDQVCVNEIGGYNCSCLDGYTLLPNGHSCEDINECNNSNGGCEHSCINTPGSHYCECQSGYYISTNNRSCLDIDECTTNASNCSQICVNNVGSYTCSCHQGYIINSDGVSCDDVNECSNSNGGCQHSCVNIVGSYICQCNPGYRIHNNGYSCVDIDECTSNTSNCSQVCINSIGGFSCDCFVGYTLNTNKASCDDINECLSDNGGCQQICINTVGSYDCQCRQGYSKNISSCIALDCPVIAAPMNGHMSCSGEQVTDQNCTFWCDPGYNISGSSFRTCLGSNQSWSGKDTSCSKSQCPPLASNENTYVAYPCSNEYLDNCELYCETGYINDNVEIIWSQTCNVTGAQSEAVDWYPNQACKGRNVCEPNPCMPGTCSVEEDAINCDCSDTYYTGERCQLGYAVAQPVPPLVKGSSEEVTLTSKPLIQTIVSITANDNSSLGINKQMISLSPQSSSGSYTVQANKSGLYRVSYDAIPGSLYIKPDDTIILVTERSRGEEPDYFTSQGLQSGHLGVGCCSKQLTLSLEQCFSNLTLHSYCQWNQTESSTDGVVHLSIASLYLPVSIAGVKVLNSLPLFLDTHYSTHQCLTCDKAPNQHCHTPSLIMDYNSNIIQTMLQYKSLSVSLFSSIKNFLPSWLKIEVHSLASSSYSVYDFMTFIGTAEEVKRLPGCDKIELADTSALIYTHRTTSLLQVTINSHPAFYHAQPVSPLCTIIDVCSGLAPTLKLAIPPSLVSKNNAASIRPLNIFIAGNAQVNFQSISLQEDGIIAPELQEQLVYWNGKHRFRPTLPTHYQYKLNINFQKTFTGQNLEADVKFKGSVYYQPNATIKEVPGLLVGKISLNVTTITNQKSVNLMLTSDEYPAIFTYPIEGASYENLPVGLSAILKYNEQLTDSFYRDHFSIPQSVVDCQILAFLSFDESLNINNVSFTTDCFTLSIGSLHFQEGLRHNILLPGSTTQDPSVSLIVTSYRLSDSPYKFGRFSFLNTNNGPVLKVMYSSSTNKLRGTLYSVNISLLNSHSISNISIANNQMTFQAQAKVFMNYDTRIIGSLATNNSVNIELNGEFVGTFRSDVSSYISQHLQNELNDVIKRSNSAIDSVEISEEWRDELYLQLTDNNDKLLQEEKQLKEDNKSLIELKANTNDALNNLTIALESYRVNNDTLSVNELLCNNNDACNNECNSRLSCQTHNNSITFSVPGSCSEYEPASHIIRQVKVVLVEDWQEQIQCQSCWETQWHKFLYISQTQCCNKIKVRVLDMSRYKIQYINSTANESKLRPCIVNNNTQLYDALNCREEISCYHEITNASCFTDLAGCLQELGESFATINSTISQLYSTYLNALLKEEEMKLIIARKYAKVYRLRENTEFLESLFHTANQSYHTNVKANETLFEETDALIPFVSSFDSQPVTEIDILEVTNISFQFMLTNYTPAILPIEISYSILDTGEEHSFIEMVNFLQPRELILRQLSGSVLESYVLLVRGTRRQKRDNHEAMASTFSSSIKFHDTCLQIKGSNLYIKQILELLGQSFAKLNSTLSLINATTMKPYTNESHNGISPIIATQYNLIKADVSKQSHSMIELLKNNSFASWQAQIEAIHSSIGPLELFGCSSYLDCIGSITNQLEDILEDTADAVQELSQLRQIKDIILQVAYNKSLSYNEAYDALKKLLTVTESNIVIDQWCTEPPIITTHPPSSVSIEINSTTELSCTASSSLLYYWVKDNITIPGSNSNRLMLTNVGLGDEGEYWCVAVNGAGSSASIPSLVNVIMKPIFNLTLPSHAYVYEEDTRGFQLTCDAYGIPAPGWMWFYKENEAHNWTLISNSNSNVLTFNNISFDDEGWYHCLALNPAGNVTSTPVFLNVLSAVTPTIQYEFVLMLSGASEEWVQPIVDLLVSETNISGLVTAGSPIVFSGNITSISFILQSDNTILLEGMESTNNELDELAIQMMSSASQLEQDKEALLLLLQRTNQLTFTLEDSTQSVSLIDYTVGPRTFTCYKEYQLDSDHLTCVACRPGSYGQVYMRSFVESETVGEYIEELVPQCLECPVGTYQENEGQSDCVSCPANYSTSRTGSVSVSDCKELCSPHHFSPTGLGPCSPCPPLTYQQYIGQRKCFPCGNDTMFDACVIPVSTTSIIKASNTVPTSNTNIGPSESSSRYYTTEHPPRSTVIKNSTTTISSKSPVPSAVGVEGKSNQFSTGAIIGIIVALVTVAILIIILIVAIVITRRKKATLRQQETSINQPSYEVELKFNDYGSHNPKNLEAESDDLKLKQDEGAASLHIDESHIYEELPPPIEEEITEETIKELLRPPLPPPNNPYSSIYDNDDDIMEKKSLKVADFYSSSDKEY